MLRRILIAALVAATGLIPISAHVEADDGTGAGPDENRDETSPSAVPPAPQGSATQQSDQVTVLRVGGQIDDFRYDRLVLEGRAGTVCAGQIRTGTLRTFYELVNRFGGTAGTMYSCRERWDAANDPDCNGTVVNPATNPNFTSTCWSNHALGRALDVMVGRQGSGYNRTRGLAIVNWLLATDAQNSPNSNARRLGVQQILFDDRCWNSDGDRGITSWTTMRECDVGHHDHVHIDMTIPGANAQVSYWGATPEVHPKPDTQVLWDRDTFWREAVSWWNMGAQNEEGISLPPGYDRAITGDWDSDGIQDEIMLWDNGSGTYFVQNWVDGDSLNARMGAWSPIYDEIIAGDWDRDGEVDDMVIWDQDSGQFVLQSWSGFQPTYRGRGTWSRVYDQVIAGDFDGDGFVNDMMLWDRGTGLWVMQSWRGFQATYRGRGTWSRIYDEIIVGDFSAGGDLDETILWDRDSGQWVLQSWAAFRNTYRGRGAWSTSIRVAAPGDYDTDGRMDDLFLYDPGTGRWSILSFHRYVPRNRLSGAWLDGFDVVSVGAFAE